MGATEKCQACSGCREAEWRGVINTSRKLSSRKTAKRSVNRTTRKKQAMTDEPKAGSEIPKPCPFCGVHVPRLQDPHTGFIDSSWMEHPKQTIEGLMCPVAGKKAYIPYWNTRAEDSALRAEVEKLKANLEEDFQFSKRVSGDNIALRAELAQAKEEIEKLREDLYQETIRFQKINADRIAEKAARERAEARVKKLEDEMTGYALAFDGLTKADEMGLNAAAAEFAAQEASRHDALLEEGRAILARKAGGGE